MLLTCCHTYLHTHTHTHTHAHTQTHTHIHTHTCTYTHVQLATTKDLRSALELLPIMYLFSGAVFGVAEYKLGKLKEAKAQQQEEAAAVASGGSVQGDSR